jgi:hypothetical protein
MNTNGKIMYIFRKAQIITLVLLVMIALFGLTSGAYAKQWRLIYFDGHMHSVRSDGSGTVA